MRWLFPNQSIEAVRSEIRKNKVAIADSFGYDDYYVIPSGNMRLEDEELEDEQLEEELDVRLRALIQL